MAKAARRIFIIAGPNGAGKTTFAQEYLVNGVDCPVFVNADLIAAGIAPFEVRGAQFRAGRIMVEEVNRHFNARESFALETTLAGRNYVRRIPIWRKAGYTVKLIFLKLEDPAIAIQRVAERVRQGGHDVPETVIRRRFHAGLSNLQSLYAPLCDEWAIYDNSEDEPILIEWGTSHAK